MRASRLKERNGPHRSREIQEGKEKKKKSWGYEWARRINERRETTAVENERTRCELVKKGEYKQGCIRAPGPQKVKETAIKSSHNAYNKDRTP